MAMKNFGFQLPFVKYLHILITWQLRLLNGIATMDFCCCYNLVSIYNIYLGEEKLLIQKSDSHI